MIVLFFVIDKKSTIEYKNLIFESSQIELFLVIVEKSSI
jgi:hypothetical protein